MNLYEVLGVKRNADPVEIKAAFRARAKDLHPDSGGSDEAFAKLNEAYMVLRDKARRKQYDETGEIDKDGVTSDLKKLAAALMSLFECAIQEDLHNRKDLDVIKLMQGFVKEAMKKKEEEVEKIGVELFAINSLADRISSKDERNLLGSIIDRKKDILENSRVRFTQELRLMKMVAEELENYTCLVEVVQMVETYFFGEPVPVPPPNYT